MARATLTSKGQITIPSEIRGRPRWRAGCRFELYVDRDDRIVMVPPNGKLEDPIGSSPRPAEPLAAEQIDRAVVPAASERAGRW